MKILHTADWHLGHRLHEHSQYEVQSRFLEWLLTYIHSYHIDILLISGDIFDTGVPSTQSQKLYYDFLISLQKTNCQHVVVTGGNHDAPGTINAPKTLLEAFSIHVVGKATEDIADEIFDLTIGDENVIIAAVPYLRDQDIRRAVAGETFDQINNRYKTALVNHYTAAAEYCSTIKKEKSLILAMGHLFAVGGSTSDSELNIYVGNLGHIGAEDFPEIFDYVALGHLHRSQTVSGNEHIRYSGSPNVLSFSEIGYDKKIIVLDIQNNIICNIEEVTIPEFRKVIRVKGGLEDCITELHQIETSELELTPWVEVVLDIDSGGNNMYSEIHKATEDLDIEIINVTVKNERTIKGLEQLIDCSKSVRELSPIEVFEKKCKDQGVDLDENADLLDAFHEVLQIVQEQ